MKTLLSAACLFSGSLIVAVPSAQSAEQDGPQVKVFHERILPVLKKHCYECHSKEAEEVKGGLRLDTREGLRAGGDSGPAITPGDPEGSLLIKVLRYDEDDRQMPPRGKLEDAILADFIEWVRQGAPDPR